MASARPRSPGRRHGRAVVPAQSAFDGVVPRALGSDAERAGRCGRLMRPIMSASARNSVSRRRRHRDGGLPPEGQGRGGQRAKQHNTQSSPHGDAAYPHDHPFLQRCNGVKTACSSSVAQSESTVQRRRAAMQQVYQTRARCAPFQWGDQLLNSMLQREYLNLFEQARAGHMPNLVAVNIAQQRLIALLDDARVLLRAGGPCVVYQIYRIGRGHLRA